MTPARGTVVMTKRPMLLACLIPALALAGCAGTQNAGVESIHQPVVTRTDHVLDLGAGAAAGRGWRVRRTKSVIVGTR